MYSACPGKKSIATRLAAKKNIEKLSLLQNKITAIPKEIGNLSKLTSLSLYRNKLTSIPAELGKLINLTYLDLGYNAAVVSVPDEICNLTKLRTLKFHNCSIQEVPSEIGNLVNLDDLVIKDNMLVELPKSLSSLTNLTRFSFRGNPVYQDTLFVDSLKQVLPNAQIR